MNAIIEYFKNNPLFFWIAVAFVAALLIVIIAAIIVHAKKAKKNNKTQAQHIESTSAEDLPDQRSVMPADTSDQPSETENAEKTDRVFVPVNSQTEQTTREIQASEPAAAPAGEETAPVLPADDMQAPSDQTDKKSNGKDDDDDRRQSYTGKWIIQQNDNASAYFFELRASNGEKLLTSIDYTSLSGARNGIKTYKNNLLKDNLVISQNKKRQYFFKLLSGSKQLLCTGEPYPTRSRCENAIESAKRFAETAVIVVKKSPDAASES